MNNQERQALISLCKIEIRRWKAATEAVPDRKYMVALMELALAALTAGPVKVPDELTMRDAIRLKLSVDWAAGYNTAIAHCKELSEPIDNTAQQYEALSGWKMVPIEPTEEMIAAWRKDMNLSYAKEFSEKIGEDEVVFAYQAMLEAAPKPGD